MADDTEAFYASVPVFTGFRNVLDPSLYHPLPPDWLIGLADVVSSTAAIAAGRYKSVNMAGAAVIAAVRNALGGRDIPFAFGGDGASFAVAAADRDAAEGALAATAAFARDDLDLALRVALVPVSAIRDAGLDVQVARFAPSPNVGYAMFAGGGLAWAEAALKRGAFAVQPGPAGARPDLAGLSCRWEAAPASRGVILSLLVVPTGSVDDPAFRSLVGEIVALIESSREAGRPLPDGGPGLRWPPTGLDLEARASRKGGERIISRRLALLARTLASFLIFRTGLPVGRFRPARYRRELVENSDFRKYDDGLRLTLDCTPDFANRLERRVVAAEAAGEARFGLHRQDAAIMTCITPSPTESDHVHFIDGADGGYAAAASRLKPASSGPTRQAGSAPIHHA
jgi:hypothetical protein